MKLLLSFLLIAALSSNVVAQDLSESEVPSVVLNAFQTKFSKATDVEWELEGDLYKCEFQVGRFDHDIWINKSGEIKRHQEEISKNDLPAAITQKVKNEFNGYRIDDVDRIDADGKTYFEVELDGRGNDRKVMFNADGSVKEPLN